MRPEQKNGLKCFKISSYLKGGSGAPMSRMCLIRHVALVAHGLIDLSFHLWWLCSLAHHMSMLLIYFSPHCLLPLLVICYICLFNCNCVHYSVIIFHVTAHNEISIGAIPFIIHSPHLISVLTVFPTDC